MRCRRSLLLVLACLGGAAPAAWAAERDPRPSSSAVASAAEPAGLLRPAYLGARVGGAIGQAFSEAGASPTGELLGGYQLPFFERRVGVFVGLGYAQPGAQGHTHDPRVGASGGQLDYTTTIRDFGISGGGQIWWPVEGTRWVPYGALGLKLHLTKTVSDTHLGSTSLGENTESDSHLGFLLRFGAGVHVGPGLLAIDATVDSAPVDRLTTGVANAGAIVVAAGYHLFF